MIEFDEKTHVYTLDGKPLISTTQLLKKHGLSPDYSGVNQDVLEAKAKRGTLIHKELEEWVKNQKLGFTEELQQFTKLCIEKDISPLESEFIVYNDLVAGTVDLLANIDGKVYLLDYKTTSTLHRHSVEWQLSIYAYLYNQMHPEKTVQGIGAIHFNGGAKFVDLNIISFEEVEKLFEKERNGELYEEPKSSELISAEQNAMLISFQTKINELEKQKAEAEAGLNEIKTQVMEAMEAHGIKSFENDYFKITYVGAVVAETLDTKALKTQMPEIYSQFKKESPRKASLRITLKNEA